MKSCPPCSIPRRRSRRARRVIHGDKTPEHRVSNAARNIVAEIHGEFGDVAAALARAAVTYQGTFTTQRVQHAALETHGGLAWVDADGVLNVRTSTQVPFLTRRALSEIFELPPGQGARVLRARRRRLWRQAGDVRRGHSGARRAEDRTAGQARADPRGAVHRDLDAASDARHGQGRRRQGRQADRAAARRALQHRRLRQPCRPGAVSCGGGIHRRLQLPEQEGRCGRRLHQHGAGGRVSRLRPAADR